MLHERGIRYPPVMSEKKDQLFEQNQLLSYKTEDLIIELQRVAKLIDQRIISHSKFKEHSPASISTFVRRFGGWGKALDAAGLSDRYSGFQVTEKMLDQRSRTSTHEDIIIELKRIAKKLKKTTLSRKDLLDNSSQISYQVVLNRFTSWKSALDAAGLSVSIMGRRYTEKEYQENLLNVWTHYGRCPKSWEMNLEPSTITKNAYINRFGSWGNAKNTFIKTINNQVEITPPEPQLPKPSKNLTPPMKKEDSRNIPISLRYKILRDSHFRCSSCGNSPAIDRNCVLHVDHILAFSRGGKTQENNLQALCSTCNIGKSNR